MAVGIGEGARVAVAMGVVLAVAIGNEGVVTVDPVLTGEALKTG